jgi:hypothetical protein
VGEVLKSRADSIISETLREVTLVTFRKTVVLPELVSIRIKLLLSQVSAKVPTANRRAYIYIFIYWRLGSSVGIMIVLENWRIQSTSDTRQWQRFVFS